MPGTVVGTCYTLMNKTKIPAGTENTNSVRTALMIVFLLRITFKPGYL